MQLLIIIIHLLVCSINAQFDTPTPVSLSKAANPSTSKGIFPEVQNGTS